MEHPSLPARRDGGHAIRADRHGHAPGHATALRGRSGLSKDGGSADRQSLLPLLSAVRVKAIANALTGFVALSHIGFLIRDLTIGPLFFAALLTAEAQVAPRIARIGVLFDDAVSSEPLRQGLRDLGYVE